MATGRPTRACWELDRGSVMPAWRKENEVRPEQSMPLWVTPPQT